MNQFPIPSYQQQLYQSSCEENQKNNKWERWVMSWTEWEDVAEVGAEMSLDEREETGEG